MTKLLIFWLAFSPLAMASDTTEFFPFFLTKMKNYGNLRDTISQSALAQEDKDSLLQTIASVPKTRLLPKLRFANGVFLFWSKDHTTRVDPINAEAGLFKVNGKMVILDAQKWQVSEEKMEKLMNPPDPARALVITLFTSWYACEKQPCSSPQIGDLTSSLRAEYRAQNATANRQPAQRP